MELHEQILTEVKKAVFGKDELLEKILIAILARGHILLEDVPGVGKTTIAKAFAKDLGIKKQTYAVYCRCTAKRCSRF